LKAKTIPDALFALRSKFDSGQANCAVLKQTAFDVLKNETNISIEYLEVVDRQTLEELSVVELHSSVVLFAGIIDGIRLIDNVEL
jgi:pantothenate synthetase